MSCRELVELATNAWFTENFVRRAAVRTYASWGFESPPSRQFMLPLEACPTTPNKSFGNIFPIERRNRA